ncbi:MAG: DUF349 domain-containing protein [Hahellaceae bacterium]|nr:DUF349 domain-containing protein [Hahellaceae bacterium]
MALLLDKLFKPKWRNEKAEVRRQAMQELSWEVPDQQTILRQVILGDLDSSVREAAIQTISSLSTLLELVQQTGETFRGTIRAHMSKVVTQSPDQLDIYLSLPPEQLDTQTLMNLGVQLLEQRRLSSAIAKLKSQRSTIPLKFATDHPSSKVRLAAAELLDSPEEIDAICKASKGRDKRVYQLAKSRQQGMRDKARQSEKDREAIEGICEGLEQLAATEHVQHYSERLRALRGTLEAYLAHPYRELLERAEKAFILCQSREAELRRHRESEHALRVQEDAHRDERVATLEALDSTLQTLQTQPMEDQSALSSLNALLTTQENRWLEATRDSHVEKREQKHYQHTMSLIRSYQAALQRYLGHSRELLQLLEHLDGAPGDAQVISQVRTLIQQIAWPDGFILPSALQALQARQGEILQARQKSQEEDKRQQQQAKALLDKLDSAVESGSVREAQPLLKELTALLDQLPKAKVTGLYQHLRLEQKRLDELRDWAGFATRPKQEELIQKMELLAQQHLEPHAKADKIRELQAEWRELGGTSDHGLWQQFKDAADRAYAPCKAYFEEESQLKTVNLQKREEIVNELGRYLSEVNWSTVDWKAVEHINRQARQEWKRYFPIDFKKGKTIQDRFNAQLQQLEERLSDVKSANAALKQAIIDHAKQLISEPDLKAATHQAKILQKEWQTIGITEHREDRQLWQSFRSACDQIFARLSEARDARQQEILTNQTKAQDITSAIEAMSDSIDAANESVLNTYIASFRELSDLGAERDTLTQAFNQAVKVCRDRLTRQRQTQEQAYWGTLLNQAIKTRFHPGFNADKSLLRPEHERLIRRMESSPQSDGTPRPATDLVIGLEILAGLDSPPELASQRMALQVERLAAGLQQPQSTPVERMEGLLEGWLQHPSLTQAEAEAEVQRVGRSVEAIIRQFSR